MKQRLLILAVVVGLFSCASKTKKETHLDNLSELNLSDRAERSEKEIEQLKVQTFNGISSAHRELAWRRLFEAKRLDQKLLHAIDYIDSLDFQAWNFGFSDPKIQDDPSLKETNMYYSVLELSHSLPEALRNMKPNEDETVFTKDNSLLSFYAIAVNLHHVVSSPVLAPTHPVPNSILTFIENTLTKEKEGKIENLSKAEQEVLKNSVLFKDTLYARYQYSIWLALQWAKSTPPNMALATEYLITAIEAGKFLKSIGVENKLVYKLKNRLVHFKTDDETFKSKREELLAE